MNNKMPIIIAIFVVGSVSGMGIAKLRKPAEPVAAHKAVQAPSKPVALDEFLVNLSDKDQARYLKAQVVLMVKGSPEIEKQIEEETPQIRDAMLTVMSQRTFRELISAEGKASLKKALRQKVNGVLKDDLVTDVYFTSFAMQ